MNNSYNSIYYLHIPKTAGTSTKAALNDNLPFHVVRRAETFNAIYGATRFIDQDVIRSTPYIHGHIPINISNFQVAPVFRLTFLRNPIDLAVSFFYYSKKLGLIDEKFDLLSFIDSEYNLSLSNIQTRWLADSHIVTPNTKITNTFEVNSADYNNALRSIANFDFIGFVEEYEASYLRLMNMLCFKSVFPNKFNVGVFQRNLSDYEINALKKLNELDIQIYEEVHSKSLVEANRKIILSGETFPSRYFYSPYRLFFDLSYSCALIGFHLREVHPDFGCFRWTTALGQVELDIMLRRNTPYKFRACIVNAINYDRIPELLLEICDYKINFSIEFDSMVAYLNCDVMFDCDLVKPILTIKVPFANRPSIISSESTDDRELGVALSWIYLGVSDSVIDVETLNQSLSKEN